MTFIDDRVQQYIQAIDELSQRQAATEDHRRALLQDVQFSRREIALSQDLLHSCIQRLSSLDDALHRARTHLKEKEQLLQLLQETKAQEQNRTSVLELRLQKGEKEEHERLNLIQDLQRRLLERGASPEEIAQVQSGDVDMIQHKQGAAAVGRKKPFLPWRRK